MSKLEPLVADGVTYFSQSDEVAFFEWLNRLECVAGFEGSGRTLRIDLKRAPTDDDLRELLALFHRYKVNMSQLARFDEPERAWLHDPEAHWHQCVFGPAPAVK